MCMSWHEAIFSFLQKNKKKQARNKATLISGNLWCYTILNYRNDRISITVILMSITNIIESLICLPKHERTKVFINFCYCSKWLLIITSIFGTLTIAIEYVWNDGF